MIPLYLISLYFAVLNGLVLSFGVVSFMLLLIEAAGFALSPESMVVMDDFVLVLFVIFLFFLFFLEELSLFDMSLSEEFSEGSHPTPRPSGVIATVVSTFSFPIGVPPSLAVEVGANDSLVCFGPVETIPLSLLTLVCLVLIPPRGEASMPLVLVGFLFNFGARLVIIALVAWYVTVCNSKSGAS
jgi:hypothetical protein